MFTSCFSRPSKIKKSLLCGFTFIIRILVKYITVSVGNTVEPSKSEKKEGSLNSKLWQ